MKTVVLTGHRKHEIGLWGEKHPAFPYIKEAYRRKMVEAIELGVEWFLCSATQGLELYSAQWMIELRKDYPQAKLAILLPFYNQEKNWKEDAQEQYQRVLAQADYMDYISKREYVQPWQLSQKNQYMIEKSDGLITFFNGVERTHPWYYVVEGQKKQARQAYELWVMTPEELQYLVDEMNQEW
ncbi:SLOG family protein [Ammoniphilus sp. YIM 78166]|uniref:SLOG family protein n=1 Tax=Ammoniphilus sp. YIM 78166 TaxID=1644106 RepID=UPI0010705ABE|nr:SLOG family protein [Ammoniphilus sp. YIM 78166]